MSLEGLRRKDIGNLGESVAAEYLRRHGFTVTARNVSRKTGELDIVALKKQTLHVVEVKSLVCEDFPAACSEPIKVSSPNYDPSYNLHPAKLRKVFRTTEWYLSQIKWDGEVQIDAVLVWFRRSDSRALVRYIPQII